MRTSRKVVAILMLSALLSLGLTVFVYAAAEEETRCPDRFSLVEVEEEEEEEEERGRPPVDRNGNGLICVKITPGKIVEIDDIH